MLLYLAHGDVRDQDAFVAPKKAIIPKTRGCVRG
jgi:hypothetical protein